MKDLLDLSIQQKRLSDFCISVVSVPYAPETCRDRSAYVQGSSPISRAWANVNSSIFISGSNASSDPRMPDERDEIYVICGGVVQENAIDGEFLSWGRDKALWNCFRHRRGPKRYPAVRPNGCCPSTGFRATRGRGVPTNRGNRLRHKRTA